MSKQYKVSGMESMPDTGQQESECSGLRFVFNSGVADEPKPTASHIVPTVPELLPAGTKLQKIEACI